MKIIITVFFLMFTLLTACSESDSVPVQNNGELSLGSWVQGSIVADQTNSYYFNTTSGQSYAVYWDDSDGGSSSYTGDIVVSAFNSNYSVTIFDQEDYGYDLPLLIPNASGESYNIRVEAFPYEYGPGTYGIKVVETDN